MILVTHRLCTSGSTLTVSEIIRLSRDGISDNAIIRQITTSGQAFHLSSNDLVRLKNAHVSDKVIAGNAQSTGGRGESKR